MESSTSFAATSATTVALQPSTGASSSTSAIPTTAPAASATTNFSSSPRKSYLEIQEEGVLNDVLEELDRERSHRAELEARVRELEQTLHTEQRKNDPSNHMSHQEYMALKTEAAGYLELLNALTQDRPAFSTKQKLPVHVVRMLEIIPWDPRARPHLFGQEQVYEWQMYRSDKTWQKELRYFPVFFKTLPIVNPAPGRTVNEAPSSASPPKQCVLTNLQMSQIINIDMGYPLPQDGGDWQWIGGWRIEKMGDTDEKGWSYSNHPEISSSDSSSFVSDLRIPEPGTRNIIKRRRKWTRSRVLVDYPRASEMTKEYLKLVSQKASLDVSLEKLSNQLVETKMSLTSLEAEHLSLQDELAMNIYKLEAEIAEKNKILKILVLDSEEISSKDAKDTTSSSNAANRQEHVKELRSVVTQWVSNTVSKKHSSSSDGSNDATKAGDNSSDTAENATNNQDSIGSNTTPTVSRQIMFDSLRGKGRDLLENIKLKGGDEIERIKQTGVKSLWQPTSKEEDNDNNDTKSSSSQDLTEERGGYEV